jgi:hypothetical protein
VKSAITTAVTVMVMCGLASLWVCNLPPLPPSQPAQPAVIIETLDPTLSVYAPMWRDEIARRFDNAVGILVHGGDFQEGVWILGVGYGGHVTPAKDIVRHYQAKHPTRTVVLLACNTGNVELGIPGVYYAKSSVFCVPDRAITPEMYGLPIMHATLTPEDEPIEPVAIPFIEVVVEPEPTRWAREPDFVGNVFEFVTD